MQQIKEKKLVRLEIKITVLSVFPLIRGKMTNLKPRISNALLLTGYDATTMRAKQANPPRARAILFKNPVV